MNDSKNSIEAPSTEEDKVMGMDAEMREVLTKVMDLADQKKMVFVGFLCTDVGVRQTECWPSWSGIQIANNRHVCIPVNLRKGVTDPVRTVNQGIGLVQVMKSITEDIANTIHYVIKNYNVKMVENIAPPAPQTENKIIIPDPSDAPLKVKKERKEYKH